VATAGGTANEHRRQLSVGFVVWQFLANYEPLTFSTSLTIMSWVRFVRKSVATAGGTANEHRRQLSVGFVVWQFLANYEPLT